MAIVFTLVNATADRLRYLAVQDGDVTSPGDPANGFNTIPNQGGVTPDLRTDSLTGQGADGAGGLPINNIMRVRLWGYGPIAAGAINQDQARALCNSEEADPAAPVVNTNALRGRCVTKLAPRTGQGVDWAVDWNVDAQGDPDCEVRSTTGVAASCYIDIHFRHSYDL